MSTTLKSGKSSRLVILPMPAPQSRAQEVPVLFGPSYKAGGTDSVRQTEEARGTLPL